MRIFPLWETYIFLLCSRHRCTERCSIHPFIIPALFLCKLHNIVSVIFSIIAVD
mgnify:CR=1 FL=1